MAESMILDRLFDVIAERQSERPEGSYVVQLLGGGVPAIAAKLREEVEEVIEAASRGDAVHTAAEAADLIFHTWVLLAATGVSPGRVYSTLEDRFGVGGLIEKARRASTDAE